MTEPFWRDDHLTLYGGDCREVLRELPDESVHCVVTSPPYWGLRDYGTAAWAGGDPECDHSPEQRGGRFATPVSSKQASNTGSGTASERECRCGARRIDSQLGLEATPEEFVANMVAVFREVRRVLRKDGTLWLNLGDSYSVHPSGPAGFVGSSDGAVGRGNQPRKQSVRNLKPKDLVGIPWRVAFALQADGWYLRSDIIWAKPNPMPESVTDRPTKAHEYLFLLTRSPRYYYDAEAVREARDPAQIEWREKYGETIGRWGQRREEGLGRPGANSGLATQENSTGRNLRSVWNIATEPYPGAHFATFPRKLVEPCVKAGTSERGVCHECGAPWVRVLDVSPMRIDRSERTHSKGQTRASGTMVEPRTAETTGWRPDCRHGLYVVQVGPFLPFVPVPAVVLDPFAGSGTTLFVAQALGRRGVGIDLSPDYLKQALERNRQTPLGLVG